jgi:UDP-glucose 4-epimerase
VFHLVYGLPTVALRYFNVFGPRQDPRSQYAAVIPAFIAAMQNGARPVLFGDGQQSRDFTFVSNVVDANLLACERDDANGLALNVACGERISLLGLVERINRLLGTSIEPVFEPERAGDVKHSLADINLAREKLGYEPKVTFNDGLALTVDYLKADRT